MTERTPVIVIGAGHNGLVCAAYLARAGRDVLVLEAAAEVGGMAVTREFAPGFRASVPHLLYLLDRGIARDLSLERHGLAIARAGLETIALDPEGRHLTINGDGIEGEGLPAADRAAYPGYRQFMTRCSRVIGRLHNRVPPRITTSRQDLQALGKLALDIRRLGRDDMREFLRVAGINIHDVLEERFRHPLLKGALSLDAVLGTFSGPRSNNSVFTALHRLSGNNSGAAGTVSVAAGAMGSVTDALAGAARAAGARMRTGCPVRRIVMDSLRVAGVELDDGEFIAGRAVVSGADPKTTLLDLLGARHLEAEAARRIHRLRTDGNTAKLHLALDGLPPFAGLPPDRLGERLLIAPSAHYVEQAFNHCKYREFSVRPVAEITIPSISDPGLAPAGKHVLSAVVQYAPRQLDGGWDEGKAAFTERVLDVLEDYAPGIRDRILATELLSPEGLEGVFRVRGGHWHHGELSLNQFLMLRPTPGLAQYRAPVTGLYLCSAGCHPGGGIIGSAGRNAARALLADGA